MLFSTYLGGTLDEQPHSLIVDAQGRLFVYGRTNSGNFPTTNGAYDQTLNGNYDIFVAKISNTGGLLASTFVGGICGRWGKAEQQDLPISPFPNTIMGMMPEGNYFGQGRRPVGCSSNKIFEFSCPK
ncbi:MAG: SBBP repeat-containing protein [Bacteroidia bacterium]